MSNPNREQEREQAYKLEALLGAEDGELDELLAIAREIRRLRDVTPFPGSEVPSLSLEQRERARRKALEAFRAQAERRKQERELLQAVHKAIAAKREAQAGPSTRSVRQEPTYELGRREPVKLGRRDLLKILGLTALLSFVRGLFAPAQPAASSPPALPDAAALGEEPIQALTVRTVLPDPERETPVMLLEAASGRTLPIWIGQPEASAISLSLEGRSLPRPLTHDLFVQALEAVGASLDHVRITHREETTYHAVLVLRDREGELRVVDARPSDAVALALRAGCPVYASETVLEEGAIDLSPELEESP